MAVYWGNAIYVWRLNTQEMASFNHEFGYVRHVIHSPLTNYVFIQQICTVEIWDVSMTGSKLIWETNPPTTSFIWRICPSRDGHRILVGCIDGSVRMWELDLENLAMNQADTMDTQADADTPKFIGFSRYGNMVATRSGQFNIEFLDTTAGEVVSRTDIDDDVKIAFSPDEDQVAFLSESLITICDTVHPNNRVSFDPWPSKDVLFREVAFQTCNDLVICTLSCDDSALLQVWHRQDPAGFECTYSLDIKVEEAKCLLLAHTYLARRPLVALDGLTVVIVPVYSSAKCYSWNHDTAQFHPIDFVDFPVDIYMPKYSPDGRLLACWSGVDSHIRVWNTRTGRLVSKFPTSKVYAMALSPTLMEHFPSDRLIAFWFQDKNIIHLLNVYTGHMYAKILGRGRADMMFIQDGTKLAHYSSDFGLRIWDIADLADEHCNSTHGYELMTCDMTDGWVVGRDNQPLFWVPVEHRKNLWVQSYRTIPGKKETVVDLSNSRLGRKWTECIDKEWLGEVEPKGKEIGNMLEKYVLSSAQVFGDVEMDR